MYRLRPLVNISRQDFNTCNRLVGIRWYCSNKQDKDEPLDGPIKYSTSPASKYKASFTRKGYKDTRLWYEPYVIMTSLTVFMIYFTILREENDIDEGLNTTLYQRIQGLEEHQLRQSLEYNRDHGKDTSAILSRLKEIEKEKREAQESEFS